MATPTVFSYTLQDNDGVKATSPYHVSYNGALETVDALIGAWSELGGMVDLITGARIISGSISIPLASDVSWKSNPLVGQSVSDALNLVFGNDDTIYTDGLVIPALRDTLVNPQGQPILTSGDPIDDLVQLILIGFTNGNYVNPAGSDLNSLVKAFQSVRKHRRALTARSTVRP